MNIITPRQAADWIPEGIDPQQPFAVDPGVVLEPVYRVTVNGVRLTKLITHTQLEQIEKSNQGAGVFGRVISKLTDAVVVGYSIQNKEGAQ